MMCSSFCHIFHSAASFPPGLTWNWKKESTVNLHKLFLISNIPPKNKASYCYWIDIWSNIRESHSLHMIMLPIFGVCNNFCLKSVTLIEAEINQKFGTTLCLILLPVTTLWLSLKSAKHMFFWICYCKMISYLTRILKKQRFFFHITKDVLTNRLVRYGFLLS